MCRSLYLIQMPPFHLNNSHKSHVAIEACCVCKYSTCIFVQHSCNNWMNVGGGRLPNKSRYGCVASAKPSPGKISQKT